MIKIRSNIFETNSSSTHSVTFSHSYLKKKAVDCTFKLPMDAPLLFDENGVIKVKIGTFGWEWEKYFDQYSKLQYLVSLIFNLNQYNCLNLDELYDTKDFKMLSKAICKYTGCTKIEIDDKFELHYYGDNNHYLKCTDGYGIDHQSWDYLTCLQDFLDEYKVTIEEFVFSPSVLLRTGNDNSYDDCPNDW